MRIPRLLRLSFGESHFFSRLAHRVQCLPSILSFLGAPGQPVPYPVMDIPQARFPQELLKIINEIAESHFVAFDLEFSGVAGRRPVGTGKLSLQELYEDTKAAAEKYQILQVGLTIVKEDLKHGRYVARPYNFNISPLTGLREKHFGRVWSHHSGGTIINVHLRSS